MCSMPKDRGNCTKFELRFYYESSTRECKHFFYGGCGGNANNFKELLHCQRYCMVDADKTSPSSTTEMPSTTIRTKTPLIGRPSSPRQQISSKTMQKPQHQLDADVCKHPQDPGTCNERFIRWYWNSSLKACEVFTYSGCKGNGNNFGSREDCQQKCEPTKQPESNERTEGSQQHSTQTVTVASMAEKCFLPMVRDPGPCKEPGLVRWGFDVNTRRCNSFQYGGCAGNSNHFFSLQECELYCREFSRFYNSKTQNCEPFIYGSCGGNQNNFDTESQCHNRCMKGKAILPTSTVLLLKLYFLESGMMGITVPPVCSLDQDAGTCKEYNVKYYYNRRNMKCELFVYTGCGGNDNKFETQQECCETCPGPRQLSPFCTMPKVVGTCRNSHLRWYFDQASQFCKLFYFSGCGGNGNNFATKLECEMNCKECK
ncbi:unnamed protein product [Soboliphyme baturini]|uniref:Kunitz/Bovine pancreatic trypsin inhibitor domain protein n=1 Tax=Soboliphyme baturini TaxID=241478 RepID=A0A183IZR8_9BILA|nr:unnamed protein product [Soboliphyme baturini]